jgi:hypothetical protein
MTNKKSLLQDSLQELENIKNESLELAKEQLINESADLLEKKSAALFEKLIAGEDASEEEDSEKEKPKEKKSKEKESEEDESEEDESEEDEKEKKESKKSKKKEMSLNEILSELEDYDGEEDDEDMEDSDDEGMEDSDSEEMSLDALRKAAEEQGFKLVANSDDEEEIDSDEEEMEMDSDEEEMEDSDDDEDIEFGDEESDEDEFSDVNVDDKVLAEPILTNNSEGESEKINESLKRNNTKMRNTKKQVLKDLRDVSFNKLVEAYYNMDEEDSFVVRENEYMDDEDEMSDYSNIGQLEEYENYEDDYLDIEDDPEFDKRMKGSKRYKPTSRELKSMEYDEDEYEPFSDVNKGHKDYGDEEEVDEEIMYEIDMPEGNYDEPIYDEELTDEEINRMLSEMDVEETMHDVEEVSGFNKMQPKRESAATSTRDKFMKNSGMPKGSIAKSNELEEMFEEMSMEELEEMYSMLEDDGGDGDATNGSGENMSSKGSVKFEANAEEDYMSEEAEIEEMLSSMNDENYEEEGMEESSAIPSQTKLNRGNRGGGSVQGRPERRSGMNEEMDEEEMTSLQEKVKKLEMENKKLQEGFTNKVKSLENKVYDVTISALKAGFVNKFLLEHPLRENEKSEIVYRFANAQTKEQIKETYISLTNEFAKGQTAKDGSLLKESVQNKVGKVHRTDNAIVTEKNLINENDETNRFKQLLNYNFGKK